jgi:hypothetical protein
MVVVGDGGSVRPRNGPETSHVTPAQSAPFSTSAAGTPRISAAVRAVWPRWELK